MHKFLLFTTVFLVLAQGSDDLCTLINENPQNSIEMRLDAASLTMSQVACRQDFILTLAPEQIFRRFKIQIYFETVSRNPYHTSLLVSSLDLLPGVPINGDVPTQYLIDQEGYYLKKSTQIIEFVNLNKDKVYFSIYKNLFKTLSQYNYGVITYSIQIVSLSSDECADTCLNNGICKNRKCECVTGFFGSDCFKDIPIVDENSQLTTMSIISKARTFTYFAVDPLLLSTKTFYIQNWQHEMTLLVNFNWDHKNQLPYFGSYDFRKVPIATGNNLLNIANIDDSTDMIIFGLWNSDVNDGMIKISWFGAPVEVDNEFHLFPSLYIILFVIDAPLCFCCLITAVKKIRRESQTAVTPFSTPGENGILQLTPELINEFSKKIKFGDSQSAFEQSTCAICLDDFKPTDLCRELYPCRHIFHLDCVDKWLLKSSKCPTCNGCLSKIKEKSTDELNPDQNIIIEILE